MSDVGHDLFLPTEDRERAERAELEANYAKAVEILRSVKAYGRTLARSGNPGRCAAGEDLLSLLEPQ